MKDQRFGFVCYTNITNVQVLIGSLNNIWIDNYRIRFYLAKRSVVSNPSQNGYSLLMTSKDLFLAEPTRKNLYAEAMKGDRKAKENFSSFHGLDPISVSIIKDMVPKI